ncbi:MAG: cbb3-type cytochrome c oxidase subunit I [Deltaproteobacteria bacterium]|nr:cbb3-type cytochrome c oxidase subunit I [Deltaproteobacteria bacterium]
MHLLPLDYYYRFLTLHGIDALLAWIIFFEVALVHFTSAALLGTRSYVPWLGWVAFALMLIGGAVINIIVLMGGADVMFTSYVPLKGRPALLPQGHLFAVGALSASSSSSSTWRYRKGTAGTRTLPLGSFGMLAAGIIGILTLAHGAAIAHTHAPLVDGPLMSYIDPAAYRLVFWGLGHLARPDKRERDGRSVVACPRLVLRHRREAP